MRQGARGIVDTHPVAAFFALAYATSWVAWLGPVLELAEPFGTLGFIVGGYGPALAALVVTWLGSDLVRSLGAPDRRLARRATLVPRCHRLPLVVIALTSVGLELVGTTVDPGLLPGRISLPLEVISAGDSTTILVVTTIAILVVVAVLLVRIRGRLGYDGASAGITRVEQGRPETQ